MISDGTFDLMRERWAQTIPKQYRKTGKDRDIYHLPENKTSAIIAPPPPPQLLERFFAAVSRKMHLTRRSSKPGPLAKPADTMPVGSSTSIQRLAAGIASVLNRVCRCYPKFYP